MKKSIVILLFISLLLACSKNYTVVTRVLPHGNGYREFLITPDSALMTGDTSKNKVPVMIDSSWKVTWFSYNPFTKKKSNVATWPINHFNPNEYNTKEITLVVHRDFASANELDGSKYYNHTSWRQIHPETVIRDKYRWFYTDHQYNETYAAYNPFKKIPVVNYLTDDEIAMYIGIKKRFAKKDSLSTKQAMEVIEKKVMEWLGRSLFEEFISITVSNLSAIHVNPSDSGKLIAAKDSIYTLLKKSEEISPAHYVDACSSYLHNNAYQSLMNPGSASAEAFKKCEKIFDVFGDEFNYKLLMPGTIISSNAEEIHLDTLAWKLTAYKYFFHNYQIVARSRTINFWSIWATGIVLLLVIFGLIVRKTSSKKRISVS